MKRFLFFALASLIISSSAPSLASANSSTPTSLVNTAKSYIGTPYVYGGTTSSGFDCSGYTQVVFQKAGISIPRTTADQFATGTAVSKSNLKTGDLVFFNTNGVSVSHVGIYIGENNFIHTSSSNGVMISSINDPHYWGSRYIGARRVTEFSATTSIAKVKNAATSATPSLPTRSDIAEILTKELELQGTKEASSFNDVSNNHPQLEAINAVANAGIFSGNNGSFNPDSNLTRAELAKVLVEAFELKGSSDISFKDVAQNNWSSGYINTLYTLDITKGYGDGNFGVNDKVTTNQFKTFIERINNLD